MIMQELEENEIQIEKTWEPVLLSILQRSDLLSQTYTPEPDTKQRNSKECCVSTGSRVHAGKAMTISENNGKLRR